MNKLVYLGAVSLLALSFASEAVAMGSHEEGQQDGKGIMKWVNRARAVSLHLPGGRPAATGEDLQTNSQPPAMPLLSPPAKKAPTPPAKKAPTPPAEEGTPTPITSSAGVRNQPADLDMDPNAIMAAVISWEAELDVGTAGIATAPAVLSHDEFLKIRSANTKNKGVDGKVAMPDGELASHRMASGSWDATENFLDQGIRLTLVRTQEDIRTESTLKGYDSIYGLYAVYNADTEKLMECPKIRITFYKKK